MLELKNINAGYGTFQALFDVSLSIQAGEAVAVIGPNGAGKTTMISIICGLVRPTSGEVKVNGSDIVSEYKITRSQIGYVPQELTLEQFETVFQNVSYTRGLYGKSSNPKHLEKILKD